MTDATTPTLARTTAEDGLAALFAPRGIAVIGASRTPGKLGAVMARSLAAFDGPLALINSRDPDPDAGLHGSVTAAADALGSPLDLAVVCVPAPASAAAVSDAAAAGVRAALVCAGGFAETGPAGAAYQQGLLDVAGATGIRLLGPNTSGFLVPSRRLTASFVPGVADVPAGRVAVVAASGGVNHALSFLLVEAGHGVSLAVGLGNGIDVTAADVLDHLRQDPATAAVALHVESVTDGRRLAEAISRLTETVPVVALVVGRNDVSEFARSHTGALATSWRTTRAVLRQAGAVLVDDERELVDAVGALSCTRLRPAPEPGVAIVTAQAGPGLLLMDRLRGADVRVPELGHDTQRRLATLLPPMTYQANPVDTGRPGDGFDRVLDTVAGDDAVDLVAVYALIEPHALDLVPAIDESGLPGRIPTVVGVGGPSADVAATRRGLHERRVPVGTSPTAVATAVQALVDDARATHRRRAPADHETSLPGLPTPLDGSWDEDQAKRVLDTLGIRTPTRRVCENADEALAALEALGGPLAVKLLDAAVLHKTEVGGVHLGVRTRADMEQALDRLVRAGAQRFLVETMAPPGADLLVGARRDPVFGPVVLVGLGGTVAEALADVTLRAAPLSVAEAASMPDDLLGRALLDGWRNGPALDRTELAHVVMTLGRLLLSTPTLDEIEINPLRSSRDGLIALDAVITCKEM